MNHDYDTIISIGNLCKAWTEFIRDKRQKKDVAEFSLNLSQSFFRLHEDLQVKMYRHGAYEAFAISDPKPRSIHKATVRDRLLHHAIYRVLYPHFDRKFIYDSYSCRHLKGTHRALNRFNNFVQKVSRSNSRTCWVLKCDIKKFFASINHEILKKILNKYILDNDVLWLLSEIIDSFYSTEIGKGLPLGNLTSQLLVNIYMNEFDQFIKHKIKAKYYIRYADDFVIFSENRQWLQDILLNIRTFLTNELKLFLHPKKISIKTVASGVDYLGWIHFPNHRVLRSSTKKRMLRNIKAKNGKVETVQSYLGLLKHGNARKLENKIKSSYTTKIISSELPL